MIGETRDDAAIARCMIRPLCAHPTTPRTKESRRRESLEGRAQAVFQAIASQPSDNEFEEEERRSTSFPTPQATISRLASCIPSLRSRGRRSRKIELVDGAAAGATASSVYPAREDHDDRQHQKEYLEKLGRLCPIARRIREEEHTWHPLSRLRLLAMAVSRGRSRTKKVVVRKTFSPLFSFPG